MCFFVNVLIENKVFVNWRRCLMPTGNCVFNLNKVAEVKT